jgi:5-methylcytosine-specific restriction endonuclease McrA
MPDPPPRMRETVLQRDDYCCLGCGADVRTTRWYSLQHRRARGTGGWNDLTNLITLCGSATTGCHWVCEQRAADAHARGLWLYSWQDPAKTPVVLPGGAAVYLTAAGGYQAA